jgi:hypothetical protein
MLDLLEKVWKQEDLGRATCLLGTSTLVIYCRKVPEVSREDKWEGSCGGDVLGNCYDTGRDCFGISLVARIFIYQKHYFFADVAVYLGREVVSGDHLFRYYYRFQEFYWIVLMMLFRLWYYWNF